MNAFLAIIGDTWRQSRTQVVLIIMICLLLLTVSAAIILPKTITDESGTKRLSYIWSDKPAVELEMAWVRVYAMTLMVNGGVPIKMKDLDENKSESSELRKYMEIAQEKGADVPLRQRAVEMWAHSFSSGIFTIAMLFFIAACAGYFPDLLAAGAVDIIVSKPLSRAGVFFGKYFGGLVLFAIVMLAVYSILYVGIGIRTGVWHWRIFMPAPLTLFAAALLYAIMSLFGIIWRSTALGIVVGYIFYIVVDSALGLLASLHMMGMFDDSPKIKKIAEVTRTVLPNFALLKEVATAGVLNMPAMDWQPFLTAVVWLIAALGFSCWIFNRKDF